MPFENEHTRWVQELLKGVPDEEVIRWAKYLIAFMGPLIEPLSEKINVRHDAILVFAGCRDRSLRVTEQWLRHISGSST